MRTSDVDILIVPGLGGSDPDHWQSRWEARLPTARRVAQADWSRADYALWRAGLMEAMRPASRPVVLVAHSLGVTLVAHIAPDLPEGRVAGAFLVAPPDPDRLASHPGIDAAFSARVARPLPFPAVLAASRDDPWCAFDRAGALARDWSARLIDAGHAGHINVESGRGPWPEGLMAFGGFLKQLG